jgi:serine protease Do
MRLWFRNDETNLTEKQTKLIMKQTISRICSPTRLGLWGASLLMLLVTFAFARFVRAGDAPTLTTVALSVNDTPVPRDVVGKTTTSFAPIVKQVAQSVVQVDVSTRSKEIRMPAQQMPPGDDMLRQFFGNQFGPGNQERTYHTPRQQGTGSGVIVSKDGYIITNNHVVDNADTIKVKLNDGREFTGTVVGRDPRSDIAVIKIKANDLPYVTIADSDKIEVGDLCLAIGNPFGIGQTVTMGIISALGRDNVAVGDMGDKYHYENFIQTDAAINPGNSGGALVDTEGRLIGINTAILSRTGGYEGIGFAVPVNTARSVMESLVAKGRVDRGYMGVSIQDITPDLAQQFNLLPDQHGALVGEVMPGSPAEKAGFKSGDVVIEFNDKPVTGSSRLKTEVADTAPGSSVPVKVLRDGREQTLQLSVKEQPGSEDLAKADKDNGGSSDSLNGVTVSDLDSQALQQMNLPKDLKGAVVTDVDQDSAAYDAGLRPGSVIQEINHKSVQSADDAVKLTENLKSKKILLKVWSEGGSHYVVVDESKAG